MEAPSVVEAAAAPPSETPETAAEKRAARERERKLREYIREILEALIRDYQTGDRGLEVREVAGGFRMATKPEYHDAVRGFVKSLKPPLKLSLQALETLASSR
jgi:segregation and condensation protein B